MKNEREGGASHPRKSTTNNCLAPLRFLSCFFDSSLLPDNNIIRSATQHAGGHAASRSTTQEGNQLSSLLTTPPPPLYVSYLVLFFQRWDHALRNAQDAEGNPPSLLLPLPSLVSLRSSLPLNDSTDSPFSNNIVTPDSGPIS